MGLQQFIKQNASTILAYIGATGVIVTAVMASKETPKVLRLLEDAKEKKGEKLNKWEKIKIAGLAYIPSIATGATTIACIFSSNAISKHQQAMLISAYALLDNSFKEYKKKVDEVYGEKASNKICKEIVKEKYIGSDHSIDNAKELFYDFYSGRYFESTKESVIWAQYEINRAMLVNGAVCLNEYYGLLGLEEKPEYEMLGWSCDKIKEIYQHPWIEFEHEEIVIDEETEESTGIECTIINIPMEPFMNYLEH